MATHSGVHPKIACARVSPSRAAHPEPATRWLHGSSVSARKYGQRVRCRMLPPIVAIVRSCAAASSASPSTGYSRATTGCAATSLIRANAPRRSPSAVSYTHLTLPTTPYV